MKYIPLLIALLFAWMDLQAQCPTTDFSLPVSACINEQIQLSNTSSGATSYFWDFCQTELKEPVSISHINGPSDVYRSTFCFDFIDRPEPTVFSLRNGGVLNFVTLSQDFTTSESPVAVTGLTGAFSLPRAVRVLEENDNYYALVTNAGSGQTMTLVDFGPTISNSATFVRLDGIGVSATNGLAVIREGNDYEVLVGANNGNTIYHLNFLGSITATPTLTSFAVTGATSINHIQVLKTCDGIIGVASSLGNDKLFLLNFSNAITNTPVVSEISYSGDIIDKPAKFDVAFDQGEYYLFLHTEAGVIHKLTFGNSLLNAPHSEKIWTGGVNGYDIKLVHRENVWKGLFIDYSVANRRLSLLEFNNTCDISPSWSAEASPILGISTPGDYAITLNAINSAGYTAAVTKTISITNNVSAKVEFDAEGICAANETRFTAISDKVVSGYVWDFGDGNSAAIASPVHEYATAGDYNVALSIIDTDGCKTMMSQSVEIYSKPIASFTLPSAPICTNNQFIFPTTTPDIYNGNLSYQWFVDNNPAGTNRDLEYTFATSGPKEIKLVTAIPGCSDEVSQTTPTVYAGPAVDFVYAGSCEDEIFSFTNETTDAVETFHWDFGNGNSSDEENATQEFAAFGDYSVSLTATNSAGCENVATKVIPVHARPTVDFAVEGPPNTCSGSSTYFQNLTASPDGQGIAQWQWQFGDPGNTDTASGPDGTHVFETPGTYTVALSATSGFGCTATGQKVITINPSPPTAFSSTPACDDVPVTFSGPNDAIATWYWEIGSAYYVTRSPTHTFRAPGDHSLYLEVTGLNGCVSTLSQTLHIPDPLSPDFSVLKNCVNQEAILSDLTTGSDPILSREWSLNGETFSGASLAYTFPDPGSENVTLKVVTEAGCSYTVTKPIAILDEPVALFTSNPSSGAYPLEVTFANTSSSATGYRWNFGDETGTSTETSPVHTFSTEGAFEVELTAYNEVECETSFRSRITTVAPLPDATLGMINLTPNADGSLKLIVTIHNRGNTILRNLPVDINLSGALGLGETLAEPILPGEKYNFVLGTSIQRAEMLQYLCVSLQVENDLSAEDNRQCIELDRKLVLMPSYPNPAASTLNIEWVSPASSAVRISLYDALGRQIFAEQTLALPGLNHRAMALAELQNGIYYLLIEDENTKSRQRILVSR